MSILLHLKMTLMKNLSPITWEGRKKKQKTKYSWGIIIKLSLKAM